MSYHEPQIVKTPKGESMVVLSMRDYMHLLEDAESVEDAIDIKEAERILTDMRSGKTRGIPGEVVHAIVRGTHRITAWRKYKKLTVEQLAKKSGVARAYITQIENKKRVGTLATLRKIAKGLSISLEELVGPDDGK